MAAAQDYPVPPELAALLDWLPVATLILADDGTAVRANRAWAALSGGVAQAAGDDDWLGVLASPDRAALARVLRTAAADGITGWADARLAGDGPERRSRWWWRPGEDGQLVVCVAELDGHDPRRAGAARPAPGAAGSDDVLDLLSLVVQRLFGIGLEVQSAAGMAHGPMAARLQLIVDELDDLIRDARSVAFGRLRAGPAARH
jgi:hypothetical protein